MGNSTALISGTLEQFLSRDVLLTIRNGPFTFNRNRMVTKSARQRDAVFRALADPTRREILHILREGQQTVGSIAGNFRMSRPAISKHLRLLHRAGLVDTRSQGTSNLCSLNAQPLRLVNDWLGDYESFWKDSLQNFKNYMEKK